MAHMSKNFNFDDFEKQIDEALEENDLCMAEIIPFAKRRPGEIGAVACKPVFDFETDGPDAA